MRNLLTVVAFLIISKVALSGDTKEKLEYVLDILGDNNYERIDTDFSDPAVTIFTPINDAEIGKVLYGERIIWSRGKNQHFQKLMVFRVGHEHKFLHLILKEGNKEKGLVFVRDGELWKNTGKYDIQKSKESGETISPLALISSKFSRLSNLLKSKKSKDHSKDTQDSDELRESVDLEISGEPEEVSVVKKYNSLEMPTIEYTPFFDKKIMRVVDRFQTVWKHTDDKKPLKKVKGFFKLGETRLLIVMTGNDFYKDAYYFEDVNDEWRSIPWKTFLLKMRSRFFNEVDPEFDMPTKEMIADLGTIESKSQESSDIDLPVPERLGSLSSLKSLMRNFKVDSPRRRSRSYTYDKVPSDEESEKEEKEKEKENEENKEKTEDKTKEEKEEPSSSDESLKERGRRRLFKLLKKFRKEKVKQLGFGKKGSDSSSSSSSDSDSSSSSDNDDDLYKIKYHLGDKDSPFTRTFSIKKDPDDKDSFKIQSVEPESHSSSESSEYLSSQDFPKSLVSQEMPGSPKSLVSHELPGSPVSVIPHRHSTGSQGSRHYENVPFPDKHGHSTSSQGSGPYENYPFPEDMKVGESGQPASRVSLRLPGSSVSSGSSESHEKRLSDIYSTPVKGPVKEENFTILSAPVKESEQGDISPQSTSSGSSSSGSSGSGSSSSSSGSGSSGSSRSSEPVEDSEPGSMEQWSIGQKGTGDGYTGTSWQGPRSLQYQTGSKLPELSLTPPGIIDLVGTKSSSSGSTPEEDEYYSHPDMPGGLSSGEYPVLENINSDLFRSAQGNKPESIGSERGGTDTRSFGSDFKRLFREGDSSSSSGSSSSSSSSSSSRSSSSSESNDSMNEPSTEESSLSRSLHLSDLASSTSSPSSSSSSGSINVSSRPDSIFHMTDLDTPSDENESQGNM